VEKLLDTAHSCFHQSIAPLLTNSITVRDHNELLCLSLSFVACVPESCDQRSHKGMPIVLMLSFFRLKTHLGTRYLCSRWTNGALGYSRTG
jgi:hypothetical protein